MKKKKIAPKNVTTKLEGVGKTFFATSLTIPLNQISSSEQTCRVFNPNFKKKNKRFIGQAKCKISQVRHAVNSLIGYTILNQTIDTYYLK